MSLASREEISFSKSEVLAFSSLKEYSLHNFDDLVEIEVPDYFVHADIDLVYVLDLMRNGVHFHSYGLHFVFVLGFAQDDW